MKHAIIGVLLLTSVSGFGQVTLVAEYPVPSFKGNTPTSFTDICLDTTRNPVSLAVCSDGGYGQFPLQNGAVQYEPPGFIAATGNFVIRGYAATPAGLSALESKGRFVFWGKQGQLPLPSGVNGTLTGLAWDGRLLWTAERSGRLTGMNPHGGTKLEAVVTHRVDFGTVESVTVHNGTLWITDGMRLARLNSRGNVEQTWMLPETVNGICFVGNDLYATAAYKKSILKFQLQ